MLEYYMLKHKPCLVVGYMFTKTESWCHNQFKMLIPEFKLFVFVFFLSQICQCSNIKDAFSCND